MNANKKTWLTLTPLWKSLLSKPCNITNLLLYSELWNSFIITSVRLAILSLRYIMRQRGQGEAGGGSVQSRPEPPMHLAVVACGERLEETLTMIKSAVLFSIKSLHLHIFAEDQLHASFIKAVSRKYLENWSLKTANCSLLTVNVDHILYYTTTSNLLGCLCSSWSRGLVLFTPGSTTQSTPSASPVRTQPSGRNSSNHAPLRGSSYQWVCYRERIP